MRRLIVPIAIVVIAICTVGAKTVKQRISYSDLSAKYEVIGSLNAPLGKLIDVKGKVLPNPQKGLSGWLEISSVNGKKLDKPVKIHYEVFRWANGVKKLEKGKVYNLRAYQDGGMTGIPHQVMKETVFVQTEGYAFTIKLVVIKKELK